MATLAAWSVISGAASVGLQAYSAHQQVEAANSAAEYNARIQERNAEISEHQAVSAEARGAEEERMHRLKVSGLKGAQRASAAASGVVADEGSPLSILKDTAIFGELDAMTIRANTAQEAWGHRTQAGGYTAQAGLSRAKQGSPGLALTTTLVSGSSRLAARYA